MDAATRRIYRELMALVNAPEPTVEPEPPPVPAEPRVEYDRRLGAAKLRAEIDRYFSDWRAFDDEETDVQTPVPTPLPDPEFIEPEVFCIRPDNLTHAEADRWDAWADASREEHKDVYLPSPGQIEYMASLSRYHGIEWLIAYTDKYHSDRHVSHAQPRHDGIRHRIVTLINGGRIPKRFNVDEMNSLLPEYDRQQVRDAVYSLSSAVTRQIRRVADDTYERINDA